MTLVSLSYNYGWPILISDILISSSDGSRQTEIPTFLGAVDDALPLDHRAFPAALKQKIYVINDRIAVGLAGSVFQMTRFLEDIKLHFRYREPTKENYLEFIQDYGTESIDECAILTCVLEEKNGSLSVTDYRHGTWDMVDHPAIERSVAVGTGAQKWKELLDKNPHITPSDSPLVTNLQILCNLITDERFTKQSIKEAWGAGFELIECVDGRFKKVDDLTYIIWDGQLNDAGDDLIGTPFLIMNYQYIDDVLMIRAYMGSEIKGYLVLPLDMKREEVDPEDYPQNADFVASKIVCTYVIRGENGKIHLPTFYSAPGDGVEAIKISVEENGTIKTLIRKDATQQIAGHIKSLS